MHRRIVNCRTGVIASDLPTGYVWANWIDTLWTVVNGGSWPNAAIRDRCNARLNDHRTAPA